MADDDGGPVDAPRHHALVAHDGFGLVLGQVVGVVVYVGRLVEHVLGEHPAVETSGGNRADLVEMTGMDGLGQVDGVPGALDVGHPLTVGVGGEVVDRGQMEEVVDLAVELVDLVGVQAQAVLGQVADDRDDPLVVGAEACAQFVELVQRAGPAQHVDRALALE